MEIKINIGGEEGRNHQLEKSSRISETIIIIGNIKKIVVRNKKQWENKKQGQELKKVIKIKACDKN